MDFYGDHNACYFRFEKHYCIKPKWNIKNNFKRIQDIETLSFNPFNFEKKHQNHQYSIKGGLFKSNILKVPIHLWTFSL
jgi:hypothetical protein